MAPSEFQSRKHIRCRLRNLSGIGDKWYSVSVELAVEERELSALRHLGLNEYESRIYLVLVRMGPIKAGEVSFFGQVPRTKTYGAIRELERKGLLRVIPGKPELYAPSSPSEVLTPLVTKLNKEVKNTEELVHALSLTYESSRYIKRDMPKEAGELWEIEGRQGIFNKLSEIMKDASKTIDYCTGAPGMIRAYKAHSEILENAKKRGATIRFLSEVSKENSSVARELGEIVDLRPLDKPFTNGFVSVDSRELVIIESRPDDLRTDRGTDLAIWTTNKLLVGLYEQLFERLWNSTSKTGEKKP
jgi:sugar-specific transcriptional regulator TrmB